MLEPGGELDLPLEALGPEQGSDLRQQHLEGHRPVVLEIVDEVDRGHPALTEFVVEAVAVLKGGGQARRNGSHVTRHPEEVPECGRDQRTAPAKRARARDVNQSATG